MQETLSCWSHTARRPARLLGPRPLAQGCSLLCTREEACTAWAPVPAGGPSPAKGKVADPAVFIASLLRLEDPKWASTTFWRVMFLQKVAEDDPVGRDGARDGIPAPLFTF